MNHNSNKYNDLFSNSSKHQKTERSRRFSSSERPPQCFFEFVNYCLKLSTCDLKQRHKVFPDVDKTSVIPKKIKFTLG